MKDPDRWGKSIMFFLTIKEAKAAAKILRENGFSVETVVGTSPNRMQILEDFENNKYQILTNVYVLTEGFNMPDLKTVFVRDSSKGPTIQMAGRVLRIHPDLDHVNIVQSLNTKWMFTKTAKPIAKFVLKDGKWKSIGSNDLIDKIQKKITQKLINTRVSLPEFILQRGKKRRTYVDI